MNEDRNQRQSRLKEEMERRTGILEGWLSSSIGDSRLTWGMVVLGAGVVWASIELIRALLFFF